MLLVSNLVLLATVGLSGAAALWHVRHVMSRFREPEPYATGGPIVVLGAPVEAGGPGIELRERLLAAKRLFDRGVAPRVIILGGAPHEGPTSEAACGRDFLTSLGMPTEAITVEEHSRHTLENLRNLRGLLSPREPTPVLLVTHRYHAARVAALASGLRIPHRIAAADRPTSPRAGLVKLAHEAYLLHWYYVGKAISTWLGRKSSLGKIT
jgi:uncharacterized SAM-binding protein YcdF (DUF218 family)